MATKKKIAVKQKVASPFQLKKEWVFDEVPPWVLIDTSAWTRIQALKTKFLKEVNAELTKAQR